MAEVRGESGTRAFTLIELLIVVVIIGVLAAIAIPNYLLAQIRSKVARVKGDHAALALALHQHFLDHERFPNDSDNEPGKKHENGFAELTTPIAYLSIRPTDPFGGKYGKAPRTVKDTAPFYVLASGSDNAREKRADVLVVHCYAAISLGPDLADSSQDTDLFPFRTNFLAYDPTNGTQSKGDLLRLGGNYRTGNWTFQAGPKKSDRKHWRHFAFGDVVPE